MPRKFVGAMMCAVLTACATSSGVVPAGNDTYLISRSEKSFDATGSRVKADALREASDFCSKSGKSMEVLKTSEKDMMVFRSNPQAEVQFRCK